MVTVTEPAKAKIQAILQDNKEVPAIRVYISGVGCAGPAWSLRADDIESDDHVHEEDGICIIGAQSLLDEAGGVTVDYQVTRAGEGFKVLAKNDPPTSCGGGCRC